MSVKKCAGIIVTAMRLRKRKAVISLKGKLGRWIKLIVPAKLDAVARTALAASTKGR